MATIEDAILSINPSAHFSSQPSDNVDGITWLSGTTPIAAEALEARKIELQTAYDALAWKRNREVEYPPLNEFAEAYCEKEIGEDSTKWDAYVTKYNLVRNNNPKP